MSERERLAQQIAMLSNIISDDKAALARPRITALEQDLLQRAIAQRSANVNELKLQLAVLEQSG
jgi:hypothetical protein